MYKETEILRLNQYNLDAQMNQMWERLKNGELLVMPTDTVYGIGAIPFDPRAVQRVLDAKQRSTDFPPPVLVPEKSWIKTLVDPRYPTQLKQGQELALAFWPGPLTIIVPARPDLEWDLGRTGGTVALRQPKQELSLKILEKTGPLAVTSANLHEKPPARTVEEAEAYFGKQVGIYVDGGHCGCDISSTIVALEPAHANGGYRIIRQGSITSQDLRQVLG